MGIQFDRLKGDEFLSVINAYTEGYDPGWANNKKSENGMVYHTNINGFTSYSREGREEVNRAQRHTVDFKA